MTLEELKNAFVIIEKERFTIINSYIMGIVKKSDISGTLISSHASVTSCAACLQANDSYVSYLIRKNKTYKGFILKYKK